MTDAGSDADPDASSICTRNPGYVFCDQFNAASIDPEWTTQLSSNGTVVLDSTHVESSPTAVEVTLSPGGAPGNAIAALERTVRTSGAGTWTTYFWVDPSVMGTSMPITFLQISFTNSNNATSAIALELTQDGISSLYTNGRNNVNEPVGIPYPFGRWVEVEFAFDLQAETVVFQFDIDQAAGASPLPLDVPSTLSEVTLQVGVSQAAPVEMPIMAWLDDSIFLPRTN